MYLADLKVMLSDRRQEREPLIDRIREGDGALGTDGLHDSPLEEAVKSEPVSEWGQIPC